MQSKNNNLEPSSRIPTGFHLWKPAWSIPAFRTRLLFSLLIFICLLLVFPYFFSYIESRKGYTFQDPVMEVLPAKDLSIVTFSIIWLMSLFLFISMLRNPRLALRAVIAIDLIFITRIVTILLLPLEPPPGLIDLQDPISNFFYGEKHGFITRDLFFSGHTSTMIMIGLLLPRKWEKLLAFSAAILVGIFVLIQHIHYSIDVLGAWVFTWFLYKLSGVMAIEP